MFKITMCYCYDFLGLPEDETMLAFKDEAEHTYWDFIKEHPELDCVYLEFNHDFKYWHGGDGYYSPFNAVAYLTEYGRIFNRNDFKAGVKYLVENDKDYPTFAQYNLFVELCRSLIDVHVKYFEGSRDCSL